MPAIGTRPLRPKLREVSVTRASLATMRASSSKAS
jgi:hypothetical protein